MGASKSIHQSRETPLCHSQDVPQAFRSAINCMPLEATCCCTATAYAKDTRTSTAGNPKPLPQSRSAIAPGTFSKAKHPLPTAAFPGQQDLSAWNLKLWNPGGQKLLEDGQSFTIKLHDICTFPTSTNGATFLSDMKDGKVLRWALVSSGVAPKHMSQVA